MLLVDVPHVEAAARARDERLMTLIEELMPEPLLKQGAPVVNLASLQLVISLLEIGVDLVMLDAIALHLMERRHVGVNERVGRRRYFSDCLSGDHETG